MVKTKIKYYLQRKEFILFFYFFEVGKTDYYGITVSEKPYKY
jgi:hypothetical protein